jgi:hypothetical protein
MRQILTEKSVSGRHFDDKIAFVFHPERLACERQHV